MMMYSTSDIHSRENGLFSIDDFESAHHYAAYNVMTAFARLACLSSVCETTGDYRKEVYSLAATNGNEGALLMATRNYTGRIEVILKGSEFSSCSVQKIVGGGERGVGVVYRAENIVINGGRLLVPAKKNEVFLISFLKISEDKEDTVEAEL